MVRRDLYQALQEAPSLFVVIEVVGHQTDGPICVFVAVPPRREMFTQDTECNRLADKSSRASPIDYIDMRIDLLQFDIGLCRAEG